MARIPGSVGSHGDSYSYYIDVSESEVNNSSNTSKVTAVVYVDCSNHNAYWDGCSNTLYIDGTKFSNSNQNVNLSPGVHKELIRGSKTITHNSDGTKSISISSSSDLPHGGGWGPDSGSASGSFTLTHIPRYTTVWTNIRNTHLNSFEINWSTADPVNAIQCSVDGGSWFNVALDSSKGGWYTVSGKSPNTTYKVSTRVRRSDSGLWSTVEGYDYPKTKDIARINNINQGFSLSNGNLLTVKIDKPCSNKVQYFLDCPSGTTRYRSSLTNNTSYTFSTSQINSLLQYFPNSTRSSIKVGVATDGDEWYYSTRDGNLTVKNSNPSFSNFTYQDTNSNIVNNLTGNNQKFIKGYSNLKVTIPSNYKMVAKNYASAKTYRIINGDNSKDLAYSNSDVSTTFNNITQPTVKVFAIDSRNFQTSVEKSLNMMTYNKLQLSININRKDIIGETVYITANGKYDTINFGKKSNNIKEIKMRIKKVHDSSYGNWVSIKNYINISNGNITNKPNLECTELNFEFGFEYDAQVYINDELSSLTLNTKVSSGKVLYSALKEHGSAFGRSL